VVVDASVVVVAGGTQTGGGACVVDVVVSATVEVVKEGVVDVVEDCCWMDVDVVCDGSVVELLVEARTLELVVVEVS
jgi:hypothetical protein